MEMDWSLILQIIGVVLGLLYLWLEYRADIRLWIVGLIMPLVHGTLYFSKGLYADASMQVYYVLAGIYGLAVWLSARKKASIKSKLDNEDEDIEEKKVDTPIVHTPMRHIAPLIGVYAIVHVAIYFFLTTFTNSTVPFLDSFTTALSVVAMWMLSRKYVEQWLAWLVVDLVTVGLYFYKGIPLTGCLYVVYSALAFAGYLRWRKQAKMA